MPRASNKVASRRRRKKVLNMAKGYWGGRSRLLTVAKHAVDKALQYQYRDRRARKRQFRRLWIARINAAVREQDRELNYSRFMNGLKRSGVEVNRKVLADLAVHEPAAFAALVQRAKASLS